MKAFSLFICLFFVLQSFCSSLDFVQNKGQLPKNIHFKALIQSGEVYLEDTRFKYVFYDVNKLHKIHHLEHEQKNFFNPFDHFIDAYAYDVNFIGANEKTLLKGGKKQAYHHNYFLGNNTENWASNVSVFNEVLYSGLYDGIDLRVYSQNSLFKYDFIVEKKSDVTQIQLDYSHVKDIKIINGSLHISLGFNTIVEKKPYAYQIINGEKLQVPCEYRLDNNILSFYFPIGYDKSKDLIIDPELIAATLSGSTSTNYGHSATYDEQGNIYTGARNFGVGYPTTIGAFQINYGGGGTDIAISKLVPDGTDLIWSTYLGGDQSEYPHSMYVSNNGELYVYGSTSSSNYPTSSNAYQSVFNGGNPGDGWSSWDIIVSHLSNDGSTLIGSTFVGGSGVDGQNNASFNYGDTFRGEIVVDVLGNAYVASFSQSDDFPVTASAYQNNLAGGQDVVVFKLNNDLSSLDWSTYIGGAANDAGFGLRLSDNNTIYVTGSAGDDSFPTTANAVYPNNLGASDGFVLELANNGSNLASSSFYGSDAEDHSFFIDLDTYGDVYIYGQNNGIIAPSPDLYSVPNSAQFIAKFNPSLSDIEWQTVVGSGAIGGGGFSNTDFVPIAFMVDVCKHIYISGHGANQGMYVTDDALYTGVDFSEGFYELVLAPDASDVIFATYYTGDHVDGGTSRFDPTGKIYQAVCSGGEFTTTADAHAPNQTTGWDIGVFKIDFNSTGVNALAAVSPSTSGCTPFEVNFINNSTAIDYFWDFDDNGNTSTEENPSYTYTEAGTYNIMLVASDPLSCNIADTLILQVDVSNETVEADFSYSSSCFGSPIVFTCANASESDDIIWDFGDGNTSTELNPSHIYNNVGTYDVEMSLSSFCGANDLVVNQVQVSPPPSLTLGEDIETCDESVTIIPEVSGQSGTLSYLWSNDLTSSSINVGTGIYWLELTDGLGCVVYDTVNVAAIAPPTAILSGGGTACADGTPIAIEFDFTGTPPFDVIYSVSGQNFSIDNIMFNGLQHNTNYPGQYLLVSVSDANCEGEVSGEAQVIHQMLPEVELNGGGLICPEDSVELNVNLVGSAPYYLVVNNGSYSFPLDTIYESTSTFYVNFEGFYTVNYLVDANGCVPDEMLGGAHVILKDYIDPSIVTTIDSAICPVDDKILLETLNPNGKWYGSGIDLNNFFHPKVAGPGEHMLYYVMEENCNETDSILINLDCELQIYIPNTFTPNNDSWNDLFVIKSNGYLEWFELNIYNRWGEKLYYTDDINDYWNGKFKNQVVQTGVYTYLIKAFGSDGETLIKSGHVHVMH